MPRRALALAALVVTALLLVAGCGGGDSGPDRTEGLTPDQLVQQTAEAAEALRSFRLDFEGEAETQLTPQALAQAGTASLVFRGPVPFSGAGPVIPPDRFGFDITASLGNLPLQFNLTRVGDDLFLSALGRDFALDLPAQQVRALNARAVFPTLAGWISEPRRDGEEEIDGENTVRLVGSVDPEDVANDLGPLLGSVPALIGGQPLTPAQVRAAARRLRTALTESTVTVWVRTNDLRPARLRVQLNLPDGSALSPDLRSARLDLTVELSDYDADLSVSPPAAPQPLDLENLGDLLGG